MGWSSGRVSCVSSIRGGWYVCTIDIGREVMRSPCGRSRWRRAVGEFPDSAPNCGCVGGGVFDCCLNTSCFDESTRDDPACGVGDADPGLLWESRFENWDINERTDIADSVSASYHDTLYGRVKTTLTSTSDHLVNFSCV